MTAKLETQALNLWYQEFQALKNVSLGIRANAITAIIGPNTTAVTDPYGNVLVELHGKANGATTVDGEKANG